MFALNCNGMGPDSVDKMRQLGKKSKEKGIDGTLISSADSCWNNVNKTCLEKLKCFNFYLSLTHWIAKSW